MGRKLGLLTAIFLVLALAPLVHAATVVENNTFDLSNVQSAQTDLIGYQITVTSVNQSIHALIGNGAAPYAYVLSENGTIMCKWNVGDSTQCATPPGTYFVLEGSDGAAYDKTWTSLVSYPVAGTVMTWEQDVYFTCGSQNVGDVCDSVLNSTGYGENFNAIIFTTPGEILWSDDAEGGNPSAIWSDTFGGSGSVTYNDTIFNNGTHSIEVDSGSYVQAYAPTGLTTLLDTTVVGYFYDDLSSESFALGVGDMSSPTNTVIGYYDGYDAGYAATYNGMNVALGVSRSAGWHQVIIWFNETGQDTVFLDGQAVINDSIDDPVYKDVAVFTAPGSTGYSNFDDMVIYAGLVYPAIPPQTGTYFNDTNGVDQSTAIGGITNCVGELIQANQTITLNDLTTYPGDDTTQFYIFPGEYHNPGVNSACDANAAIFNGTITGNTGSFDGFVLDPTQNYTLAFTAGSGSYHYNAGGGFSELVGSTGYLTYHCRANEAGGTNDCDDGFVPHLVSIGLFASANETNDTNNTNNTAVFPYDFSHEYLFYDGVNDTNGTVNGVLSGTVTAENGWLTGDGGWVEFPVGTLLTDGIENYTYSYHFKWTNTAVNTGWQSMFYAGTHGNNGDELAWFDGPSTVEAFIQGASSDYEIDVTDGSEHAFAVTVSGNAVQYYVDGVNVANFTGSTSGVVTPNDGADALLREGSSAGTEAYGMMRQFRVYERALSAGEIALLANETAPPIVASPQLMLNLTMESINSTHIIDTSGNDYNFEILRGVTPGFGTKYSGQAIILDNGDGVPYVQAPGPLPVSGAFTYCSIMEHADEGITAFDTFGLNGGIQAQSSGSTWYLYVQTDTPGNDYLYIESSGSALPGAHDYCFVYDGGVTSAADSLKIYTDGVLQTTTYDEMSGSPNSSANLFEDLTMGTNLHSFSNAGYNAYGMLDEVVLYNYVRSDSDLLARAQALIPPPSYWSDDAESGAPDTNGWYARNGATPGDLIYQSNIAHQGTYSINFTGSGSEEKHYSRYVGFSTVNATTLEFWFYDYGQEYFFTGLGNAEDTESVVFEKKTGVNSNYYIVHLPDGDHVTTAPLSQGWHRVDLTVAAGNDSASVLFDGDMVLQANFTAVPIAELADIYQVNDQAVVDDMRSFPGTPAENGVVLWSDNADGGSEEIVNSPFPASAFSAFDNNTGEIGNFIQSNRPFTVHVVNTTPTTGATRVYIRDCGTGSPWDDTTANCSTVLASEPIVGGQADFTADNVTLNVTHLYAFTADAEGASYTFDLTQTYDNSQIDAALIWVYPNYVYGPGAYNRFSAIYAISGDDPEGGSDASLKWGVVSDAGDSSIVRYGLHHVYNGTYSVDVFNAGSYVLAYSPTGVYSLQDTVFVGWMYDDLNDSAGFAAGLGDQSAPNGIVAGFYPGFDTGYAVTYNSNNVALNIPRTEGWHQVMIQLNSSGMDHIYLDGQAVVNDSIGEPAMKSVALLSNGLGGTQSYDDMVLYAGAELPGEEQQLPQQGPVNSTGFDGATTNFSGVNTSAVDYPVLEKAGSMKIEWNGADLNFSGAELSTYVTYGPNWVSVASNGLPPGVNTSANVTITGSFTPSVEILADGVACNSCTLISADTGEVSFGVAHFTNYSISNVTPVGTFALTMNNVKSTYDGSAVAAGCVNVSNTTDTAYVCGSFPVEVPGISPGLYNVTLMGMSGFYNDARFTLNISDNMTVSRNVTPVLTASPANMTVYGRNDSYANVSLIAEVDTFGPAVDRYGITFVPAYDGYLAEYTAAYGCGAYETQDMKLILANASDSIIAQTSRVGTSQAGPHFVFQHPVALQKGVTYRIYYMFPNTDACESRFQNGGAYYPTFPVQVMPVGNLTGSAFGIRATEFVNMTYFKKITSPVWNRTATAVGIEGLEDNIVGKAYTAFSADFGATINTSGPANRTISYTNGTLLVNFPHAGKSASLPMSKLAAGTNVLTYTVKGTDTAGVLHTASVNFTVEVSKLAEVTNIQPSGVTLTDSNAKVNWTAATGGAGTVTYDVISNLNGTNVTQATGVTATQINATLNQETVSGMVWVIAHDDLVNTTASNAATFNVSLNPVISNLSCAAAMPNEDNLPSIKMLTATFNVYAPGGFSGDMGNLTLVLGQNTLQNVSCAGTSLDSTHNSYSCSVPINYYQPAGAYQATAGVFAATGKESVQALGTCSVSQLLASKRTVDAISFPTAGPGVSNAAGSSAITIRNTGNVPVNLSMTAYDLVGRTTPVALLATTFKGGANLTGAVQMQDGIEKNLNMQIMPGNGSQSGISLWLSMPTDQEVQQYYSPNPWQIGVTG